MTDWIARGPDDFGDFTISSQGEELAKCVVVQNGFRTPEETKSIAEQLIKAVNNHEALVYALTELCQAFEFCVGKGTPVVVAAQRVLAAVGGGQLR